MKKRAISEIFATILLAITIIILMAVIWNFSGNQPSSKSDGNSQLFNADIQSAEFYQSGIIFSGGNPAQSQPEETIEITIQRLDNENPVKGIRFIFEDSEKIIYSYDDYNDPPNDAQMRIYSIKNKDIKSLGTFQGKIVSISFILENGQISDALDQSEIYSKNP